jgi:hypothetical protein
MPGQEPHHLPRLLQAAVIRTHYLRNLLVEAIEARFRDAATHLDETREDLLAFAEPEPAVLSASRRGARTRGAPTATLEPVS